jgi:hypothetical protein
MFVTVISKFPTATLRQAQGDNHSECAPFIIYAISAVNETKWF